MSDNKTEIQVQQAIIEILQDCIEHNKKIVKRQSAIIILLICLLFGGFCYYVHELSEFDVQDSIVTTTKTNATNDNKVFEKNSSINASINDVNVNNNIPRKEK